MKLNEDDALISIEREVKRLAAIIGAPDALLPTFDHPIGDGRPFVEINRRAMHYVLSERGKEYKRKTTFDDDQLLFWIFSKVTFIMASDHVKSTASATDYRHKAFREQERLLSLISPDWSKRQSIDNLELLNRYP
jgi:hypothetical protein